MKNILEDTIAAVATPMGMGAISVIRMSGKESLRILKRILGISEKPKPRFAHHGWVKDPENGDTIDEVIYIYYETPRSYTGEDMAEIFCHGGILITQKVLSTILKSGARMAEPGEFTKRAFLNGKMDLMQSEAVRDLIESRTEMGMKLSIRQLRGDNSKVMEDLRKRLMELSTEMEVHIDYPEEDLPEEDMERWKDEIKKIVKDMEKILRNSDVGMMMKNGVKTVIIGKTNVGKSTLLNRLLKEDRAIVTEIPGTTRDVISEDLNIHGILIRITDTAGVRKTKDRVEIIGLRKTMEELERADLVLFVVDGSKEPSEEDFEVRDLLKGKGKIFILILNKIDLGFGMDESDLGRLSEGSKKVVKLSALKGDGIDELENTIADIITNTWLGRKMEDVIVTNLRQMEALRKSQMALRRALENFESYPIDMISLDIRESVNHIDEILGRSYTDDLLDGIFKSFCVGK